MSEQTQDVVSQLEQRVEKLTVANRQLQRRASFSDVMAKINQAAASTPDAVTLSRRIVRATKDLLELHHVGIYLIDHTGTWIELSQASGKASRKMNREGLRLPIDGESCLSWVARQQEPYLSYPSDLTGGESRAFSVANNLLPKANSELAVPLISSDDLIGVLDLQSTRKRFFDQEGIALVQALADQIASAMSVIGIRNSLHESHLMLDISRNLSGAASLREVYDALEQSVLALGADRCTLYTCDELDHNNLPTYGQIVFTGDSNRPAKSKLLNYRFPLAKYEILDELVYSQETLVIDDVRSDERLSTQEQELLRQFDSRSLVINPLVLRSHVIGFVSIEHHNQHQFTERELALYRTLCNQSTTALEHARQFHRTREALAETQTLYRAGRVLAGAEDFQDILQEALIEFVYSFSLDQGGITMLTPDKQFGQLRAYVEKGQLEDFQELRFPVRADIVYQQLLMSGQPFTSYDVANDIRLAEFRGFNHDKSIKSTLQAPMIIRGETIGWIGVDAVNQHRDFTQKDVDLARAMADQIAIAIQNHRLLEQTERRAEQLKAVATVGEAVTGLLELDEVLKITVDLIRDRFGYYHVSIFLLDDRQEWAVVRASTGDVGKIMVERPHRLGVGSNSIVGFVTANATPRIALDVGQDAVHFNNPLLPDTRSEMALPLSSRGVVIGALDVQSVQANAFTDDDIETLQVMADQVTTAIENARLFEQTQRRLREQALLYSIGTKIGGTLQLQETTDILVSETAEALDCAKCVLTLLEDKRYTRVLSEYVREGSQFSRTLGNQRQTDEFVSWPKILSTKHEFIVHIDTSEAEGAEGWEYQYLKDHNGTGLVIVPILLRNEVIGALEVYDDKAGRRFKYQDIALLDNIALLAANAIENARLYETAYESQAFMKAIIEQIPDPIFIKDREHKWVVVNTAFSQNILGQSEEDILGEADYDVVPKELADWFWKYDDRMFDTGDIQEIEEQITDIHGKLRTLYTRKIPLSLSPDEDKPEYLIGIINDISNQKLREAERERLMEETRKTLERTQTLYRISNTLAAADEQQATFEAVLGEYLQLLELKQGRIMLFNNSLNANVAQARYVNGKVVSPTLVISAEEDKVFQQLLNDPTPVQFSDPKSLQLTKNRPDVRGRSRITSMLFIPLVIRNQVLGTIILDATAAGYVFDARDIKIGVSIAEQLTIWLENRRLLVEAQHRSNLLQTAAEVSRAASSILEVDTLINNSVNLIRDQFDFYYVGLFLADDPEEWAVLRAGTGEAGRIQLENSHRLKIGGGSMIGWSIENGQARIALDVGEEADHFFKNPILPDTHSEMALPLISRDEVIGALTVQSVERGAFSDEDIVLLQTMADQLANAIKNARLFSQTQEILSETEVLYQITQRLSLARDEETIYNVAIEAISQTDVDFSAIYMYLDLEDQDSAATAELVVEQKEAWTKSGTPAMPNGARFRAADFAIAQLVPEQGRYLVDNVKDADDLPEQLRQALTSIGITSLLILPLSTYQGRLGFLAATYKSDDKTFNQKQIRFYTAIAQQLITALENARLLDASQRRARREEIIRDITLKIRNAVDVDDILKTTVVELGKVLGASRGSINLSVEQQPSPPQSLSQSRPDHVYRTHTSNGDGTADKDSSTDKKSVGKAGNNKNGQ